MKSPKNAAPWLPTSFTEREAYAMKAWANGTASEDQQKLAFEWMMRATGIRDELFVPGQDDTRCYLMGRRSIGLQAAAMLKWKPADKPQGDG